MEQLVAEEEGFDNSQKPLAERIRDAIKCGEMAGLVAGFTELRDAPMSIKLVECAHRAGAVMMNEHELYTCKTLRVRALLNSYAPLVAESASSREVLQLEKRRRHLEKQQPEKAGARQQFFGRQAKSKLEGSHIVGNDVTRSNNECMQGHGEAFKNLDRGEQRAWGNYAKNVAAHKRKAINDSKQALQDAAWDLERKAKALKAESGLYNNVTEARFSDDELQAICDDS